MSVSRPDGAVSVAEWPEHGLERVEACPVCEAGTSSVLHADLTDVFYFCAPGRWTLRRCHACGSAFLDPRPTADTVGLAYRRYFTHAPPPSCERRRGLRAWRSAARNGYLNRRFGYALAPSSWSGRLLMRLFPRVRERADRSVRHLSVPAHTPRLLDVGCGNGAFLTQMKAAGWHVQGLEPDPLAVASAREAGVPVERALLADEVFPPASFDAITLNHVVEHLHDPVDALRICHRLLRPGGVLWIATPNVASPGHVLFRREWIGLDAPRHLVLFTPGSLVDALGRAGFDVVVRPPACVAGWYYAASTAVRLGSDPLAGTALPPLLRWRARAADLAALARPERSEEIVVLARKSPSPDASARIET